MNNRWVMIGVAAGSVLFLLLATILPFTTTSVFASPDETAVAAFARGWTWEGGFRISTHLPEVSVFEGNVPDWLQIPGIHPRSMVRIGNKLVPVGFLGMPLLFMPFEKMVQGSGSFFTALLVLSSAFALFHLVRALGDRVAWTSVIVYLTFPTVLLYANRGLFPNLPVIALALWTMWLLRREEPKQDAKIGIISGILIGLALIIRPVEAVWMLPWVIWAAWGKMSPRRLIMAIIAIAVTCGIAWLAAVRTYGSWIPTVGYWLSDSLPAFVVDGFDSGFSRLENVPIEMSPVVLPFGIHPRAMWSNIQHYLFGILGPWMAAALAGWAMWMWKRGRGEARFIAPLVDLKRGVMNHAPTLLTGWTLFILLVFYGQSRYADNINQTATIGNSFLRYMLPLVPLIGVGIGMLIESVWTVPRRGKILAVGLVAFFAIYGPLTALMRDEEGILPVQHQLQRYDYIRATSRGLLAPGTIVLSERSDKIFVGLDVVSVSPMPSSATIDQLKRSGAPLALFHRILTDEQRLTFANGAFKDWLLASVFDNEAIYIPHVDP